MNPDPGSTPDASPPGTERIVVIRDGHRAHRLPHHTGETLLETARRGSIALDSNCERGSCGTCIVNLLKGTVTMLHNEVLSQEDLKSGLVLACQAVPTSVEVEIERF